MQLLMTLQPPLALHPEHRPQREGFACVIEYVFLDRSTRHIYTTTFAFLVVVVGFVVLRTLTTVHVCSSLRLHEPGSTPEATFLFDTVDFQLKPQNSSLLGFFSWRLKFNRHVRGRQLLFGCMRLLIH